MAINFHPLNKRVLVKPSVPAQAGAIVVVKDEKDRPTSGLVIESDSPRVERNNTVFWSKFAGVELTIDGEAYVVLKEDDLLGRSD